MLINSPAIALQIRHWSQTSHMVTWLTPEHGRIVTAVKGACRPKSAFLGQYDLFYTCDLLYYQREHDGVHAIRECWPLKMREALRGSWRHAMTAGYLAELTARVVQSQQHSHEIYNFLTTILDKLPTIAPAQLVLLMLQYEVAILQFLGVQPDITLCPHCHPIEKVWIRFSLPSGRFQCRHRSVNQGGESTVTLHRKVRALYLYLVENTLKQGEMGLPTLPEKGNFHNLVLGLSRFLGIFMYFHLDVPAALRRVTCEMVETKPHA